MINHTTSSHLCTMHCMFFFSYALLTRLSTYLFLLYSLFVCLYLHFVVYSSASDLKQQWEVNPSPTPSLQVDAFHSSHLCVFLFLYYFWVCILSLYFRSRTSPCPTVQSRIRWRPRARTTPGCSRSRRTPSTAPSPCPARPWSGRRPPASPPCLAATRTWSRGAGARRAGGRWWPAPPPPRPSRSASGTSWTGWRGEQGRGVVTIFLRTTDPQRKNLRLPEGPLRRDKSWLVVFNKYGQIPFGSEISHDTKIRGQNCWCTLDFYFYVIRLRMRLFLLRQRLFWKSQRARLECC